MKKLITIFGILLIIIIGFILLADKNEDQSQKSSQQSDPIELQGEKVPILGREHVPEGTGVTNYNSNPPTSGNHWPEPAQWGFYDTPLSDEQLVHNLEHGGIWISYKDIDDNTKQKLRDIADAYPQAVIITPRAKNDTAIALASWGRLQKLDSYNEEIIENFINANVNNAPEPLASVGQMAIAVGNVFPDFSVFEVGGKEITRDSLKGRPTIVWFTTEFCVPCQIGAREVAKLDDELGGSAFDVIVIFVDPRETEEDLRSWRKRFAREDWMVAFDNFNDGTNSLSAKVGLKYLDSKYLLDKNGVIQNIDFQIANEKYLNLIRDIVEN